MENSQEQINQLTAKLRSLMERHQEFSKDIVVLREELYALKNKSIVPSPVVTEVKPQPVIVPKVQPIIHEKEIKLAQPKTKTDFEKFIGENLINKIGILITVIGVIIGAKYSIEHELISPLTRIILGYLSGLALLGFGFKLKEKYEKYSAVLVSGAMAILYFITFAAYDFYQLFPQLLAFGLMLVFTAFTVFAAINYKRQIIAHFGLVGAYAVPFLLSNDSGNVFALFIYVAIINVGILLISLKQYWKSLYYSAFAFTWIIYFVWYLFDYRTSDNFLLGISFLFIFFILFYATFLAYKLVKKENFNITDVILLLSNSFVFFGIGISMFEDHPKTESFLGLFTLANGLLHALVSGTIYKLKLADRNLLHLIAGLVMVFITIAVPIQLDGNWVSLLWIAEAVLLFWLGRNKNIGLYETLSYPIMILSVISLVQDWSWNSLYFTDDFTPFFNISFLTGLIFIGCFGVLTILSRKHPTSLTQRISLIEAFQIGIPVVFLSIFYFTFFLEINDFWSREFSLSHLSIPQAESDFSIYLYDYDLEHFRTISLILYSIIFLGLLSLVNIIKLRHQTLGKINLGLNVLVTFVFLGLGLYVLSELRESYLSQDLSEYYNRGFFNLVLRYISYVFVIAILVITGYYSKQKFMENDLKIPFDIFLHLTLIWFLSSELLHWMSLVDSTNSYKLGLSILWGVYALFLIIIGIWKQKQHLRIGGIVVFGLTLVKLFLYDISHMETIAKTIVFVALGVLLLIISFLYNKYKSSINNETSK